MVEETVVREKVSIFSGVLLFLVFIQRSYFLLCSASVGESRNSRGDGGERESGRVVAYDRRSAFKR